MMKKGSRVSRNKLYAELDVSLCFGRHTMPLEAVCLARMTEVKGQYTLHYESLGAICRQGLLPSSPASAAVKTLLTT